MSHRRIVAIGAGVALVLPALAAAELGPHSTWYAQHKVYVSGQNNVNIVVSRVTHKTDINGTERCLGTYTVTGEGAGTYSDGFDVYPVMLKNGKLSFRGHVNVYGNSPVTHKQEMHFSATVTSSKATGKMTFPGTHCGTIKFTAKKAGSTP